MSTEIKLPDELQEKIISHLDTMDKDAKTPWILKPPSIIAILGILIAVFQWAEKGAELAEQKTEVKLQKIQLDLQKMQVDLQKGKLLKLINKEAELVESLKNSEIKLATTKDKLKQSQENLNFDQKKHLDLLDRTKVLENEKEKISEKLGQLSAFVLGEKLTDIAILSSIQTGIIASKRSCYSLFKCRTVKVSLYLTIPFEFEKEVNERIDIARPIKPREDSIKDGLGNILRLESNTPLKANNVSDEKPWNKWSWTYDAYTAAEEFEIEIWIKSNTSEIDSTCYLISFPKDKLKLGTQCPT